MKPRIQSLAPAVKSSFRERPLIKPGTGIAMSNCIWPKRLFALDISRGLAALAVVIWHWQHFAYNGTTLSKGFVRSEQPLYAILKLFYERGLMAVDYFFLLSGFIFFWLYRSSIEERTTSFSHFWIQRFSRLYPLHFITLLIVAALQMAYISHNGRPFVYSFNDIYHFSLNLFFIQKWGFEKGWSFNAPTWSVSIEILLYLLFFAIAYIRRGYALFCLGVAVCFLFVASCIRNEIFNGISLFFLGGFVFSATKILSANRQGWKVVIYISTLLCWGLTLSNFYILDISGFIERLGFSGELLLNIFPYYILFPLTICSLALLEIDQKKEVFKSVAWIGDITYASYLLHFPLQLIFGLAAGYKLLNSYFYLSPIYLVIFFSLLISVSYLTFIGFERPVQDMIRNFYRRHTHPA
jgi:peptidoglycan/LPS O-acetylase OafA/YrhL